MYHHLKVSTRQGADYSGAVWLLLTLTGGQIVTADDGFGCRFIYDGPRHQPMISLLESLNYVRSVVLDNSETDPGRGTYTALGPDGHQLYNDGSMTVTAETRERARTMLGARLGNSRDIWFSSGCQVSWRPTP